MLLDVADIAGDVADIVDSLQPAPSGLGDSSYTLRFRVLGRTIPARLTLGDRFPAKLPEITLDPATLDVDILHLETSGKLCYCDPEGLSISLRHPHAVVIQALRDAHRVLSAELGGTNCAELIEELNAYWAQYATCVIRTAITPGEQVKGLDAWRRAGELVLLSDNKQGRSHLGNLTADAISTRAGLYVPVSASRFDRKFIRSLATSDVSPTVLFSALDQDNTRLMAARRKRLPARIQLVLGVGEAGSERALVGLELELGRGVRAAPRLFNVTRVDRGALLPRAGRQAETWIERVVLIGCGALGGHVATAIARMGIRELTLVDPDSLAVENAYRHVLGFADVDEPKAEVLARRISADLPHVRTLAVVDRAEALPDRTLRSADLVIVTIGDATKHRDLNRRLFGARGRVVFGWLEPLGVGGHALLTGAGAPGCVECLFLAPDGGERLSAWSDFAAPNQTFARRHIGCAGAFTPFADLDARRTADLVSELVAHALSHPSGPARLRSWKGDTDHFLAEGYTLSHFASLTPDERQLITGSFVQSRCPVCGR